MGLKKTTAVLAAGAIVAGFSLAGCGQIAESATEKLMEQAAGGSVNVDIQGDGVTVEGSEGAMSIGGSVDLPDNWPAEVPTYGDGTLVMVSVDKGSGSATAMWNTDQSVEDAAAAVKSMVEAAGYSVESESNMADVSMFGATGNGYRLDVSVGGQEGSTAVTLVATKQ
ncbi:MAG: hypothetical protein KGP12_00405 [Actinomycetales bacterium]|nr:hypothetical protein [Actinomycetales bacterium]